MNVEQLHSIAVIGAGQMGTGICELLAKCRFSVTMIGRSDGAEKAMKKIQGRLSRQVSKGLFTEAEIKQIADRISPSSELSSAAAADVVIETVVEDMAVKCDIFRQLDTICATTAPFFTNTSTLSPTELGRATTRPQSVCGFHFMNPPSIGLIEIVPGMDTSAEVIQFATTFAKCLGKSAVIANEYPGGVASRILIAMRNEAIRVYAEGIASAEDIDTVMTIGARFPIGPLALTDLIGLDVHLFNAESLARELGPQYLPHPIVRKMVRAGRLGRKSGRGFYSYK